MLVELEFPPGWFRDTDSIEVCRALNLPAIAAVDWVSTKSLPNSVYTSVPELIHLEETALDNKLHVIKFKTYDTYYIHPKKLEKLFRKRLYKQIRSELEN